MQLTIANDVLKRAFSICKPFVPGRTTNDALKFIKLSSNSRLLEMVASDGESSISQIVSASEETMDAGVLMLPADRFGQVLHESQADNLSLSGGTGELTIRESRNTFEFLTINENSHPPMVIPQRTPEASVSIRANDLRVAFERTVICADQVSAMYALGGVRLEGGRNEIFVVATDTKRMAVERIASQKQFEIAKVVPHEMVRRLIAALGSVADSTEVQIEFFISGITFQFANTKIFCKEMSGQFPRWRAVVPPPNQRTCASTIAEHLAAAVRQARLGREDGDSAVRFDFIDGRLRVSAGDATRIGSKIDLPISYSGPHILVSLDPDLLLQWVRTIGHASSIEWHMTTGENAVMLISGESRYVQMPLWKED